jgi:hypothetical protein
MLPFGMASLARYLVGLVALWTLDSVPGCIGNEDDFDPDASDPPGSAGAAAQEDGGGGAAGSRSTARDSDAEAGSSCDATDLVYAEFVLDRSAPMAGLARGAQPMTLWEATTLGIERALSEFGPGTFRQMAFPGSEACTGGVGESNGSLDARNLDELRQAWRDAAPDPDSDVSRSTRLAWYGAYTGIWEAMEDPLSKYHRARGYVVLITQGMPGMSDNCFLEDHRAASVEQLESFIDEVSESDFGIKTLVIGLPGSEDERHIPTSATGDGPAYDPREMLSRLASAGQTAREGCSARGPRYCHADLVEEPDTAAAVQAVLVSELAPRGDCEP